MKPARIEEADDRLYVAESTIRRAGRGLFAKVPLERNESIEVIGMLVAAKSAADRCTAYADAYKFQVGRYLLVPMGYGGMANHSSSPNMEKIIRGPRVYLRALRRIEKDEELLFAYSAYAQKRFKLRRRARPAADLKRLRAHAIARSGA